MHFNFLYVLTKKWPKFKRMLLKFFIYVKIPAISRRASDKKVSYCGSVSGERFGLSLLLA